MTISIDPVTIEAHCFRAPLDAPLATSFGVMRDRPALFVRVVDAHGAEGWGETWCNFPTVGAEHRARLVAEVVGPRFLGRTFGGPEEAFATVGAELEVLVLQSAELGPIGQALAGIDVALWDLAARKAGEPLYRALGGTARAEVPVYASGLDPDRPERLAARRHAEGHRAFKLKIGFSQDRDLRNLEALHDALGADVRLMVDANQAYDLPAAVQMSRAMERLAPAWFEEPMRADAPLSRWRELAHASPVALAGGENLRGAQFDEWMHAGVLGVVQPDVGKWGGLSGTLPIARRAVAAGLRYCPHWLGGGVGLMASLHALAAAGGEGLLELDANPNPLREIVAGELLEVRDGRIAVPQGPGLGLVPRLGPLERYRTWPPRR